VAELWLVAGPNGAGKTTLVHRGPLAALLTHATFLNPDDVALELLRDAGYRSFSDVPSDLLTKFFLEAANAVFEKLTTILVAGEPVVVETVLSSNKYRDVVDIVLRDGGFFGLIYVWLDSPETACARVKARVEHGGHDVPAEKIAARWQRSVEKLSWFLPRATRFWIYDNTNSDPDAAPFLLAEGGHGKCSFVAPTVPSPILTVLPERNSL
jgi:predicted ABC-type ATPase